MRLVWTGPFPIREYLRNAISRSGRWRERWPPERDAVYLVSRRSWRGTPTKDCLPLYVGGNTGSSARFCTRVGDLIADLHGFYGDDTGHHSGGIRLWEWCDANRVHPGDLYLAWSNRGRPWCAHCAERYLFDAFPRADDLRSPGLQNRRRPPGCHDHG